MDEQINKNINPIKAAIVLMMGLILLLTLASSFLAGRSIANDKIRAADIELIGKFLQAYRKNEGIYPQAVNGMPRGWQDYLEKLPSAPAAASGCSAEQNKYTYQATNDGGDYTLSFCLGNDVGSFTSGTNTLRPADYDL